MNNQKWPWEKTLENLKNLDSSLKLQSILAAPDHAWIGPSVIELALEHVECLEKALNYAKAVCHDRKAHKEDMDEIENLRLGKSS